MKNRLITLMAGATVAASFALPTFAQDHKLRIQTHFSAALNPGEFVVLIEEWHHAAEMRNGNF